MKHNELGIFVIMLVNYNEPYRKVLRYKVPSATVKVINSKNEELPVDVICEKEGECVMYVMVEMEGWGETAIKIVSG